MAKNKRSKKKVNKKGKSRTKRKKTAKKRTRTKRETTKHPGLDKRLFSRIKQEYFDLDYIDSLNEKEKVWMSKFMTEYLGANLKEENKPFHKSKRRRKDVFDMNNAKNRDIFSIAKATGTLSGDVESTLEQKSEQNGGLFEDQFIDLLDEKRRQDSQDD